MRRQTFLLGLLLVVILFAVPVYYFDRANASVKREKTALDHQLALLRQRAAAVRQLEAEVDQAREAEAALEPRLIGSDPFAQMEREIRSSAAQAGIQISQLKLTGSTPVEGLPLVQYTATVELSGTVAGAEAFLRQLEQHPLLIQIPDLQLKFSPPGAIPAFRTTLSLYFYGKAPSR